MSLCFISIAFCGIVDEFIFLEMEYNSIFKFPEFAENENVMKKVLLTHV